MAQIEQAVHTALNWMDYAELKDMLVRHGFAVSPDESEDDLREAVRSNVLDGTIDPSEIDTSGNPERPAIR